VQCENISLRRLWVMTSHAAAGCVQAQALTDAGHVPDKVIMLDGPHALLLDRVKYRRIDYSTGWRLLLAHSLPNQGLRCC
jgi:hypothetical protein